VLEGSMDKNITQGTSGYKRVFTGKDFFLQLVTTYFLQQLHRLQLEAYYL
jgi:hypothetical protein